MKRTLLVEFKDHDKVILTNESGDTYTSKSEELMDFLHLSTLPDEGEKNTCSHPDEYYFKDEDGGVHCTLCGKERPS